MTRLMLTSADDPVQLQEDLRRALDGGPALGLGLGGEVPSSVAEGTAVVIGTSGSTGVPKQVMLSAAALRASAEATADRIGSGRWMLTLPAGYVAGLQVLVRSLVAGTAPVLLQERFSAQAFADITLSMLRTAPRSEALFTSLVPPQLATLVDAADDSAVRAALQAYRAILVGGQALPEQLRERAADLGVRIVRTYGSTETSGGCVYDGIPLEGVTVREIEGELRIAGPTLADGYLGDDEATARTFVHDEHGIRWYRTGDLGVVADGVVRVHGRADNVIVSGGINVSLDRVERLVRQVPGLASAVVVGVQDARWGEASVIVAPRTDSARADSTRTEADLLGVARARVADELGKHARPARIVLVDDMPVLASGKPDREAIGRAVAERD